jgi:hypothetical protein
MLDGAPGESRTPTPFRIIDFESIASTSSATGAYEYIGTHGYAMGYCFRQSLYAK